MHISLYMAISNQWNQHRFKDNFPLNRKVLMELNKIGSKGTYHSCIKVLHQAGYIRYQSSGSKWLPPRVAVPRLDMTAGEYDRLQIGLFTAGNGTEAGTSTVPNPADAGTGNDTGTVPDVEHLYKQTKRKRVNSVLETPTLMEVTIFFKENKYPTLEAKKFWYYNESKHWLLADGQLIRQWEPLAHKWMLSVPARGDNAGPEASPGIDRDKNYDEPL